MSDDDERFFLRPNGTLGDWCDGDEVREQDSYVVQQFTGIRDTKKKEIYEGDIVQLDGAPYLYEIHWKEYQWGIYCGHESFVKMEWEDQTFNECVYERCTVVGNIFETPEKAQK